MDTLKKNTIQVFETGKTLISDLRRKIHDYTTANNAGDKHFMQGFSFDSALAFLDHVESLIYNEANRKLLREAPEDSRELQNIFTSIDQNNKHLFEIETSLNVFFKNLN